MKYYNVHNVDQDNLEDLLNSHVKKGYALHYIRNAGGRRVQAIFFKDFTSGTDLAEYAAKRQLARQARREEKSDPTPVRIAVGPLDIPEEPKGVTA